MSDLPKDNAPEGSARPDPENTRTERWVPTTDAGSEGQAAQDAASDSAGAKPGVPREAAASEAEQPVGTEVDVQTPPGERIAKAMARAGMASRRDAEAMILAGRVSVNGEVLASPARNVTEADRILVDGEPMPSRERSRLWIFHKPRGVVTTAKDPEGRQTVFDILPEDLPRVVAVGRLDINTEGLLLLTNDGGLAKVIAHPDTGWLRRYRVRAHGDTDQAQLDRLAKGVTIDGMEYGPVEATLDRVQGDNCWLTLGLREGKNREVKRILEHLGLSVNRLIRLSFGPFQLGDLEVGLVEEVRTRVLKDQLGKTLATQAGVDFESPVREPVSPFGSTKKSERDPSSAQGAARRNAARPTPAPRVSTGGAGSGPRNATWRADDGSKPRGTQIPRRGADPRSAQAAAAERGRERVGSIRAGERRVLVERLAATPVEPVAEATPRRRYADRSSPERPQRNTDGRPDREAGSARGFAPRGERGAGERVGGARSGGERAHGERAYGERPPREASRGSSGPRFEGRQDDRRGGKPGGRRDRPFDGPAGEGAPRGKGGFRPQRSASSDGKPAFGGGKPGGGFRAGSARPGGKPGGKPGGFSGKGAGTRPGGRPGGRDGAKPGGGRPPRGTR